MPFNYSKNDNAIRMLLTTSKLAKVLEGTALTKKVMTKSSNEIVLMAKILAPKDTGKLIRSFVKSVYPSQEGGYSILISNTATNKYGQYYAGWVHRGTGKYGPSRRIIRASKLLKTRWKHKILGKKKFERKKNPGYMMWKIETQRQKQLSGIKGIDIGDFVKVKSVKGQKPQPFLLEAAQTVLVNRLGGIYNDAIRSL